MVRVLAFLHMAPVFSHKSVNNLSRIGIGLFLTYIMLGTVEMQAPPEEGYFLPYAIIMNIVFGIVMGFVAKLMFNTITAGGEMMDSSMGLSSGQMFDPSLGSQTTIMGRFMGMLSIVIFFTVGGPEMLIEAIQNSLESFDVYAPSLVINPYRIIHLTGDIITMGFMMVSPVVLTILVNDLVLGLISRLHLRSMLSRFHLHSSLLLGF